MDMCDTRHEPKFQVTYMGAKCSNSNPVWLVCDICMGKKCFGNKDQIVSMDVLV
jgi:hypothetical protein